MRPRTLDLFAGAGGAGMGLYRAGFDVVGIDIKPQPRYPAFHDAPHAKHFTFHQADAMTFPLEGFDFIWASPPCQAHSAMKTMPDAKSHLDLIPATRRRLLSAGIPFVIENVEGAPLLSPILLCGTMFGLGAEGAELRRHRLFEASFPMLFPACLHGQSETVGVYGGHIRNRKRARTIGVCGEGGRDSRRKFDKGVPDWDVKVGRAAMDISWMTIAELCQAIPPSYAEFIARQFLDAGRVAPRNATPNATTEGHSHRPGD